MVEQDEKKEYTAEDMINNAVKWVIKINAPSKEFLRFDGFAKKYFNDERWVALKYLMDTYDNFENFMSLFKILQDLSVKVEELEQKIENKPQDSSNKIKTFGGNKNE